MVDTKRTVGDDGPESDQPSEEDTLELLEPEEATDSDEIHNADGDETVEPPDHWAGVNKYGMSAAEAETGESLDRKLSAERPDTPSDAGQVRHGRKERDSAEDNDQG